MGYRLICPKLFLQSFLFEAAVRGFQSTLLGVCAPYAVGCLLWDTLTIKVFGHPSAVRCTSAIIFGKTVPGRNCAQKQANSVLCVRSTAHVGFPLSNPPPLLSSSAYDVRHTSCAHAVRSHKSQESQSCRRRLFSSRPFSFHAFPPPVVRVVLRE